MLELTISITLVALLSFALGAGWSRERHIRNCDCLETPAQFPFAVVPPHTSDTVDPIGIPDPFNDLNTNVDIPIPFTLNEQTEDIELDKAYLSATGRRRGEPRPQFTLHVGGMHTKPGPADEAWLRDYAGFGIVRGDE